MCFWAAYTLGSVTNLQKTASKSLLEMLQNTLNLSKNFCFYTEIFSIQKSENENLFLTFLRMLKAEIYMEMNAASKWIKKKVWSVGRAQG
jgi:hypothetical protein